MCSFKFITNNISALRCKSVEVKMYYLYDDFNDRRMHANHALLMSSMEVASILEALLNEPKLLKSAVYGGAVNPPG